MVHGMEELSPLSLFRGKNGVKVASPLIITGGEFWIACTILLSTKGSFDGKEGKEKSLCQSHGRI